jgi:antitoxin ParD1/3/4
MSSNQQSGKISVTLTSALAGFVREQTRSGKYSSASEVIQEALQLLEAAERIRSERFRDVKVKITEGLRSLDRGEGIDGETAFSELEAPLITRGKRPRR